MQQQNQESILSEIFIAPSNQTRDSHAVAGDAAQCSGKCSTGVCRTVSA